VLSDAEAMSMAFATMDTREPQFLGLSEENLPSA
jgi:hypothetical protein